MPEGPNKPGSQPAKLHFGLKWNVTKLAGAQRCGKGEGVYVPVPQVHYVWPYKFHLATDRNRSQMALAAFRCIICHVHWHKHKHTFTFIHTRTHGQKGAEGDSPKNMTRNYFGSPAFSVAIGDINEGSTDFWATVMLSNFRVATPIERSQQSHPCRI